MVARAGDPGTGAPCPANEIRGLGKMSSPAVPSDSGNVMLATFRHGYTARRCGEAGPAPGGRKRRKSSHPGSAENGLPPATRGEMKATGPSLRLLMPERARRACLCGTHGGKPDGFAGFLKSDRYHRRNRRRSMKPCRYIRTGAMGQTNTVRKGHGRGTGVADINRRAGR